MVDVCLITDEGYADYTYVCIKSMLFSKNKASKYNVFVLLEIQDNSYKFVEKKLTSLSCRNFNIKCIKASSEKYKSFELSGFHVKSADLLKFDLMNIFTNKDKLLYLDGDIIVNKDLSDLFNIDLCDNYFAANYHAASTDETKHRIGLSLKHVYNAGVLLFNLKKMRDENLYEKLIETRKTNEYILKAKSLDQLTFNFVCKEHIKEFNPKHHLMFRNNWDLNLYNNTYHTNYQHFNNVINDATIIHFVGPDCKPWKTTSKAHDLWKFIENENSLSGLKVYDESNYFELKPKSNSVIVFSFDSNVTDPAIVAMYSLLENAKDTIHIICCISNDVCIFNRARIVNHLKAVNKKFFISFIGVESVLHKSFDQAFVVRGITKPAYYRLFMSSFLPNFKKVVYSDIDVVFKKDIFDVYSLAKDNKAYYAVPSVNLSVRSKFDGDTWNYYFNSGFLVANLDRIRRLDKTDEIDDLVARKLNFQDQDILNKVYKGEIGKVPPSYCLIPSAYTNEESNKYSHCCGNDLFSVDEVNQLSAPHIIHYAGVKPWNNNKINLADEWQVYCDKIFDGNFTKLVELKEEKQVVNVTQVELSKVIGKEYLIKRLAGIRSFQVNINDFRPCCVVRSFDMQHEVVFSCRDDFSSNNKKKKLIDLKRQSKIVLVEQYIKGSFDVTVDAWLNVSCQDNLSSNIEAKLIDLSKRLIMQFPQFRYLDFLIAGDKVYFKRFRNE